MKALRRAESEESATGQDETGRTTFGMLPPKRAPSSTVCKSKVTLSVGAVWWGLLSGLGLSACNEETDADFQEAGSGGEGNVPEEGTGGADDSGSGGALGPGGSPAVPDEPARFVVEGVTTWRHDAVAAYTIFHDDTCNGGVDNQFDVAEPALTSRNLVASFGAIAADCEQRDLWDELQILRDHGHEIANHSFSHERLTDGDVNLDQEIDEAHHLLSQNLTDFTPTFFIFPYDAFNDELLERLSALDYLGARAGGRGHSPGDFSDPFRIQFDVYGPGYSVYVESSGTPCAETTAGEDWSETPEDCRAYIMNQYVEDLIASGGYGIRELHSLENEAWEPIPTAEYEAHLDFLVDKVEAKQVWVATASDAIRYRFAREICLLPVVSGDELRFGNLGPDCTRFATGLTYRLSPLSGEPTSITALQGDVQLPTEPVGDGSFLVTADPKAGPVVLSVP